MRNVPPDKYNVAWFKLAECVSRGEKERALGVYRLLAHSLNDSAFARQLQGDILFSFNDTAGAVEHYRKAAQLYHQDGRYLEAAALYEHIVVLTPDKQEALMQLIELYRLLDMPAKIASHGHSLCLLLLSNHHYSQALSLLDQLEELSSQSTQDLCRQVVCSLAKSGHELTPLVERLVARVVTGLIASTDAAELQRFMATLETLNEAYYRCANQSIK
jgi:tetratricopeptide (TPR) repeat protein